VRVQGLKSGEQNVTIKAKIISLVVAFGLVAAAITALGLKTVHDYEVTMQRYNRASENVFRGERLNRLVLTVVVEARGVYMAKAGEALERADRLDAALNAVEAYIRDWRKDARPGELPELEAVARAGASQVDGTRKVAELARTVSIEAAKQLGNHESVRGRRLALQAQIDLMITRITNDMQKTRAELQVYQQNRVRDFVLIAAAGTLALLAASFWVAISAIANPLNRVRQSIIRISEGAYDTLIPITGHKDEIGEIWGALAILKDRAEEADRLTREKLETEQSLRELVLD
jgi:methyl-accepting chemotaxis protein